MWPIRASGAALVVLSSAPAQAFVCSRVQDAEFRETGPSLSWFSRNLTYAVHASGTSHLPADSELSVINQAFDVWEDALSCGGACRTDVAFNPLPARPTHDLIGFNFLAPEDNENLLIFRDSDWPHTNLINVIALTTTSYSPQSGEIFDADVEFNSQQFQFADLQSCCPDCDGNTQTDAACQFTDLMNTAVHEIGHMLGLGHTNIPQATMAASAQEGETLKRDLDPDDLVGVLFKYPDAEPNDYCDKPACATGVGQCGACNLLACQSGESCGFCPPPDPLTATLTVTTLDSDDGMGGCGCAHAPEGLWGSLLGLVALRVRRRYFGR
ncbi:MAG: matrixin family metalloprotease [Deltaproteobacteria bacterium]|nr:matrixin family metalloprotease [Deltaproteobacteria bacterium]